MKIDKNKIEKLKVIKINNNNIIVENIKNEKGIIYISNISRSYIVLLTDLFEINDIIYGVLINIEGYRRFYSLIEGHNTNINEIGGGCLGIFYLLERIRIKNENMLY